MERKSDQTDVALAAFSLAQWLTIALLRKGVLTHDELDGIFQEAIEGHRSMAQDTTSGRNGDAVHLLEDLAQSIEWVWPRANGTEQNSLINRRGTGKTGNGKN